MPPGPETCRYPGGTALGAGEDTGGPSDEGTVDGGNAGCVVRGEVGALGSRVVTRGTAAAAVPGSSPPRRARTATTPVTTANTAIAATIAIINPLSRPGGAAGGGGESDNNGNKPSGGDGDRSDGNGGDGSDGNSEPAGDAPASCGPHNGARAGEEEWFPGSSIPTAFRCLQAVSHTRSRTRSRTSPSCSDTRQLHQPAGLRPVGWSGLVTGGRLDRLAVGRPREVTRCLRRLGCTWGSLVPHVTLSAPKCIGSSGTRPLQLGQRPSVGELLGQRFILELLVRAEPQLDLVLRLL